MPKKRKKIKPKAPLRGKVKKRKKIKKKEFHGVNFLAPEFVYYKKGFGWYLILGLIGLGLIALAFWLKYWLLSAVIFLSLVVFLQYSKFRPKSKKCRISKDEILIDDKKFRIDEFEAFTIYLDQPNSHLFLERVKRLRPSIWLHIKNEDLKRIIESLSAVLPAKKPQYNFLVNLNRWMRF